MSTGQDSNCYKIFFSCQGPTYSAGIRRRLGCPSYQLRRSHGKILTTLTIYVERLKRRSHGNILTKLTQTSLFERLKRRSHGNILTTLTQTSLFERLKRGSHGNILTTQPSLIEIL
jgi:hypothetical protein